MNLFSGPNPEAKPKFLVAFSLRAAAIVFNIRMGPPGEFIRIGKNSEDSKE